MMQSLRTCLIVALALLIASPLAAAPDKKGKGGKKPAPSVFDRLARSMEKMNALRGAMEKMSLTDEQKGKLSAIRQDSGPKFKEVMEAMDGILTDQQKEARREAIEKATADGKKGRELVNAVEAAMKLTDEQKGKLDAPAKKLQDLLEEVVRKIMGVLTDEQQKQFLSDLGEPSGRAGAAKGK